MIIHKKYGEESKGGYSHITETMFSCVSGIGNVREYRKIYFTINYVLHKLHKADEKGLIGLDTFLLDLDQKLNSGLNFHEIILKHQGGGEIFIACYKYASK